MIQSYRDPKVKRLHDGESIKAWASIRRQAEKRLRILDAASVTAWKFFTATGRGNTAPINDRWRLCFTWPSGALGSGDVEIVDYH
jgi:proteic killer suppression protein